MKTTFANMLIMFMGCSNTPAPVVTQFNVQMCKIYISASGWHRNEIPTTIPIFLGFANSLAQLPTLYCVTGSRKIQDGRLITVKNHISASGWHRNEIPPTSPIFLLVARSSLTNGNEKNDLSGKFTGTSDGEINKQVIVVDCRPSAAFSSGHIIGAENISLPPLLVRRLSKGQLATSAVLGTIEQAIFVDVLLNRWCITISTFFRLSRQNYLRAML